MNSSNVTLRLPVLALVWLLGALALPLPAGAAVVDNAGFFSANARSEANRRMAEMQRVYRKELEVETFPALPPEVQKTINLEGTSNSKKVFQDWTVRKARERAINGVYVAIVKSPGHLEAVVGNDTQKRAFTLQDRDALVSLMLGQMRQKNYDRALLDGVDFVSNTLRAHAGTVRTTAPARYANGRPAQRESSGWGWLVPLLIIGAVIWVVISIFRAIFRGFGGGGGYGQSGYGAGGYGAPGYGSGGGGFMRSLFGSMLGAGAGMWLYDSFFGGRSSAWGAGPQDRTITTESDQPQPFSGQDTDYDSSGGDFGGGDSGGGGGDFGGGGDSGGGGGDF